MDFEERINNYFSHDLSTQIERLFLFLSDFHISDLVPDRAIKRGVYYITFKMSLEDLSKFVDFLI